MDQMVPEGLACHPLESCLSHLLNDLFPLWPMGPVFPLLRMPAYQPPGDPPSPWPVGLVSQMVGCCSVLMPKDLQFLLPEDPQTHLSLDPDSLWPGNLDYQLQWSSEVLLRGPDSLPKGLDCQLSGDPVSPLSRGPQTQSPLGLQSLPEGRVCRLPEDPSCQPHCYTLAGVTSPSPPLLQWAEYWPQGWRAHLPYHPLTGRCWPVHVAAPPHRGWRQLRGGWWRTSLSVPSVQDSHS